MKRPRIINALFVPAFDLVGNDGGFFQCHPVEQSINLHRSRCVRQSFVRDRADDLMSKRAVPVRRNCESDRKNNRQQRAPKPGFHFQTGDDTIESRLSQKVPARLSAQLLEFKRICSIRF